MPLEAVRGVGGIPSSLEELTLIIVGVGYDLSIRRSVGGNVTHAVIGITILLSAAGHGCHLHGGLDAVNVPIGILP